MEIQIKNLSLFADQSLECGEGPVWDPRAEQLYWTDASGEALYTRTSDEGVATVLTGFHAGGLALHRSGGLVFGGRNGFFRWDGMSVTKVGQAHVDGVAVTSINDIIADPEGRVFGGQEAFRDDRPYEPGYLFRIDPDGTSQIVEEGLHLSNGMAFSPSCDTFYLVDTIQRTVFAYDYSPISGSIANRRKLFRLDRAEGLPDGMTVDMDGYLWVARWFGGGISRYDPDGVRVATINLPAAQVSSLAFGGVQGTDLFVTTAAQYWQTNLAPAGHDFLSYRGGGVYRIQTSIAGLPGYQATI